jgi:hypothetical protein
MNTNHTVILGSTAIGISTAIQLNRNPALHSQFRVQFNRRQNRFSKTSASSRTCTSCEVSHRPNGSSQVIYNRWSFGHRFNFRIVPTHQITVSSFQSSTVVLIGPAVGLRSSPQNSNVRSAITSAGLIPLPTSAHPLDRCPPLSQLLRMRPLYTGDLVEDGCLHRSWAGLRCRVSLYPGFPFGL